MLIRSQNTLYNSALKQAAAVKRDLGTFSESPTTSPPSLQGTPIVFSRLPLPRVIHPSDPGLTVLSRAGQISASLTSFLRTVDDYSALSKQELIPAKQEKAFERVKNFRAELSDLRQQFDQLKKEREDAVRIIHRSRRGDAF
jgi:golgi SNAP receptor complex member 2